jgi:hypothetical protein
VTPEVICELRMPDQARFLSHIRENARFNLPFLKHGQAKGLTVAICGAGPSLKGATPEGDHVWGVNSALNYLKHVTHGFTIDQGIEMLGEWSETFPVEYLIATSVNPALTAHLSNRKVSQFHSHLGVDGEDQLYRSLYPTETNPDGSKRALRAGHGLNGVPRAVCLALGMGYEKITVYGADSAALPGYDPMPEYGTEDYTDWLKGLVLYADGRTAFGCYGADSPFCEAPDIEGKRWHTRPDMIVSAVHLLELQEAFPGRIEIVGEVLPNVLKRQPKEFWDGMPSLTPNGTVTGFGIPTLVAA